MKLLFIHLTKTIGCVQLTLIVCKKHSVQVSCVQLTSIICMLLDEIIIHSSNKNNWLCAVDIDCVQLTLIVCKKTFNSNKLCAVDLNYMHVVR